MDEIYTHALKLLRCAGLHGRGVCSKKLEAKFRYGAPGSHRPAPPEELSERPAFRRKLHRRRRERMASSGSAQELIGTGVSAAHRRRNPFATQTGPRLSDALTAKMIDWKLRVPLQSRDAARLFRALARLGYDEDAIREEIEQLHEQ